jgi:heme/copper-type cytochrome/quinol oxidase subunit 2
VSYLAISVSFSVVISTTRPRRVLAARRQTQITELVWVVLPVAVVLLLAARSWIVAFDLGPPAVASVAPVEVSAQPSSPPILHR